MKYHLQVVSDARVADLVVAIRGIVVELMEHNRLFCRAVRAEGF